MRQYKTKSDTGPFRRILVATDFSTGARMALRRVSFLPLADSCVIKVVHVAPKATPFADSKQISDFPKEQLSQEVEDLRAKLHGFPQATVTSNLIHGANPVDHILKLANSNKSELIVMGRHGASGFKDLLIGSVAERVVIRASSPVLVVGKMPRTPYTNAMGAIDDDAVALEVLRFLIRISPQSQKHAILHAWQLPYESQMRRAGLTPESIEESRKEWKDEVKTRLKTLLTKFAQESLDMRLTLRRGDARFVITSEATSKQVDLIALGTLSRPGFKNFILGSVAQQVLQNADRDILVIRQKA